LYCDEEIVITKKQSVDNEGQSHMMHDLYSTHHEQYVDQIWWTRVVWLPRNLIWSQKIAGKINLIIFSGLLLQTFVTLPGNKFSFVNIVHISCRMNQLSISLIAFCTSYIMAVSFIYGGNQSTLRKPLTCWNWQRLSDNVVSSRLRHEWDSNSQR
jgi:hypothetical protein